MTFSFHPDAESELFGAIDWYESQEPGLGEEFAAEITAAILRVLDFPDASSVLEAPIRRCLVNRFPYGILYTIEADEIIILAVMHLHREPGYWKSRET